MAAAESKNWKQEMHKFLRNYRATPHCSTKVAPAAAMFGENIKTRLPEISIPNDNDEIRENDQEAKLKMKMYADRRSKPCMIETGDAVVVKQPKENKLTTPFNPKPYKVLSRKGSMITAQRGSHKITRNSSHFKPIIVELENEEETGESENEESSSSDSERETELEDSYKEVKAEMKPEPPKLIRRSSRFGKQPIYLGDYVIK